MSKLFDRMSTFFYSEKMITSLDSQKSDICKLMNSLTDLWFEISGDTMLFHLEVTKRTDKTISEIISQNDKLKKSLGHFQCFCFILFVSVRQLVFVCYAKPN